MNPPSVLSKNKFTRKDKINEFLPIHPRFLDFHRLKMNGSFEYPEHTHHQYELIWIQNGVYKARLNGTEIEVENQQLLLIKPGDIHQDHLKPEQIHCVLHFSLMNVFSGDAEFPEFFADDIQPEQQILGKAPDETSSFFENLEKEILLDDPSSHFILDSLMETFFWKLVRIIPPEQLSSSFHFYSEKQIFKLKLYHIFEQTDRRNLDMDIIAGMMNVSKRTLTNKCRFYFDESPARLLRNFILSKGASLLRDTNWTVSHISEFLGYENPFHFSRLFKNHYGWSPGQFRGSQTPTPID